MNNSGALLFAITFPANIIMTCRILVNTYVNVNARTSVGSSSTGNPYYSNTGIMTLHLSKKIALQLYVELQFDLFVGNDIQDDWNAKEKSAIFVMKENFRRVERRDPAFHPGWRFFSVLNDS